MFRSTAVLYLCLLLMLTGCPPQRQPVFYKLSKYADYTGNPKHILALVATNPPDRPYIIIGLVSFFTRYDVERNRFYEEDDSVEVMEKLGYNAYGFGAEAISFAGAVPVEYLKEQQKSIPYGIGEQMQGWVTAYAIKWADEGDVETLPAHADPRPAADSLVKLGKRFQSW